MKTIGFIGVGVMGNAGFLNLDMDGKRFMNEDLPGQQLENQIEAVRLMQSWQFFDANWPEQVTHMPAAHGGACYFEDYASANEAPKNNATYRNWKSPYQLEAAVADGRCLKADTLEELVALVYPDDEKAQETALASIARYNELAAKGYDEDFNKVPSRLMPVDTAPFYADMFSTAIMLCIFSSMYTNYLMAPYELDTLLTFSPASSIVCLGLTVLVGLLFSYSLAVQLPYLLTLPGLDRLWAWLSLVPITLSIMFRWLVPPDLRMVLEGRTRIVALVLFPLFPLFPHPVSANTESVSIVIIIAAINLFVDLFISFSSIIGLAL